MLVKVVKEGEKIIDENINNGKQLKKKKRKDKPSCGEEINYTLQV